MAGCTNIDRKTFILSVAGFVCMLLLQIGTVIWWASNLASEVKGIKDDIANHSSFFLPKIPLATLNPFFKVPSKRCEYRCVI